MDSAKLVSTIETDAGKVLHFLTNAESKLTKVGPQVQSAMVASLQAVVTAVTTGESAVAAGGLNFTLDAQTVADVKSVATNFKADLQALGIKL